MKLLTTLLVSTILFTNCLTAQNTHDKSATLPYFFAPSTGTYADLVGATSINGGITWDDPNFTIPLGFSFQYFSTSITSIYFNSNGTKLRGGVISVTNATSGISPVIRVFDEDLYDNGNIWPSSGGSPGSESPLSYKLEGAPGSQIFKLEWNNVNEYTLESLDTSLADFFNFQLWLYEGTNDIEIHFGPSNITFPTGPYDNSADTMAVSGSSGPTIALMPAYDYPNNLYSSPGLALTGSPTAPTAVESDHVPELNGTVPDGMIYKFKRVAVGIDENNVENIAIDLYPNPTNNTSTVSFNLSDTKNFKLSTYDILGNEVTTVKEQKLSAGHHSYKIDLTKHPSGVYFVKVRLGDQIITKKIHKN